ncbi:MAG: Tat pathway signal protein [Bacteroidetes bacterium]|nr:MAG: Tat pathway signal protein [Bacteroidota bacterium]
MKLKGVLILAILFMGACSQPQQTTEFISHGKVGFPVTADDNALLDSIQYQTFLFFRDKVNLEKGLFRDRAREDAPSSIASTAFALPTLAVAVERNWMLREEAAGLTYNALKFLVNSEQSDAVDATGYKGFYYHYLDMETGKRTWESELSSIDTGLLLMGVIFSRNYYSRDNETEGGIREMAEVLLSRLDWSIFNMGPETNQPKTISMGWRPEDGLIDWGWYGYNEGLFLYILAAGTGMENIEESYEAWLSTYTWKTPYPGLTHVAFPPLFGHQFSHAFIDFRGLVDPYMKEKGIDYFENSRRATLTQQQYAIENPHGWKGYGEFCWGVTAGDGPGEDYNFGEYEFLGYAGRGAAGPNYNYFDDGTIAPYGALSSLPFAPEIVFPTARYMLENKGDSIWGPYGFYDAFNETAGWVNDDYIGVAQGPMLVLIENFRSGLIWDHVMQDPIIQKGLNKLGFEYLD